MTAEQQLERSVLEGKERDELSAIAQAMSLKTTSRTKKADIIDQILDATGVTSGTGAERATGMRTSRGQRHQAARRSRSLPPALARGRGRRPPASRVPPGDGETRRRTPGPADGGPRRPTPRPRPPPRRHHHGEAAGAGDSGPAVFVEPPELADGADHRATPERPEPAGPEPAGQPATAQNQNNQSNQNRNQPTATWATGAAAGAAAATGGQGGRAPGRRPGAALHGRAGRGEGHARPARRGLRLPALRGLPALVQGRLRLHQPGPPLRAAPWRLRRGRVPAGVEQREVPGAAAHRHRSRASTPRRRATGPASRT